MKILRLFASLSLAALTVIPLAACGENNTSSEMESTVAVTETARDETTSAFSDTTVPDTEFDLKSLHAIHDNGNDFAGAWHITERDAGDTYSSFTYVFDGNTSSYLITGSMGYISKYEINPDIKQMASQMMFGEWKSRITQVRGAAAGFSSRPRHIPRKSVRSSSLGCTPRSGRYHSSISPISISQASMSNTGMS